VGEKYYMTTEYIEVDYNKTRRHRALAISAQRVLN
jgi:hypothetical protein